MSRTILVKLYVDEAEQKMIKEMAKTMQLPINRFLRSLLCEEAYKYGYDDEMCDLFTRTYVRRDEN